MYQLAARMGAKKTVGISDGTGFQDVLGDVILSLFTAARLSVSPETSPSKRNFHSDLENKIDTGFLPVLTADLPCLPGASAPHAPHHLRPGERRQGRDLLQDAGLEGRSAAAVPVRPGETCRR